MNKLIIMGRLTRDPEIRYGGALVPFRNEYPENSRLYKLMTTKPGELTSD